MELRTILVNLDIDFYSPKLLKAAVDLAQRFGARIIAVAAASAPTELIAVEGAAVSVGLYEAERAQVEDRLNGLEAEFRESVPAALRDNCLVHLGAPNPILTRVARRADLILIRSHLGGEEVRSRNLDVGELLLAVGRPVLLVEPDCATVKADSIVVAWKDSREARRAVSDAVGVSLLGRGFDLRGPRCPTARRRPQIARRADRALHEAGIPPDGGGDRRFRQ